jgi:hypothetical protein
VKGREFLTEKIATRALKPLVGAVTVPQVGRQPLSVPQVGETVAATGALRVGSVQGQVGAEGLPIRAQVGSTQRAFKAETREQLDAMVQIELNGTVGSRKKLTLN